ncbi:DUF588 domain-containing protein [Cephalotus follicularis]|uniref:CASP-like protein n=1 Tax=Cephalotus follicularis TaxID=3775 RepID=A0A1Q3CAV5_CEPFO|nr:DUF588 domain-containing protein [Cephalotus follicularis]
MASATTKPRGPIISPRLFMVQNIVLRALAVVLSSAAGILMFTGKQSVELLQIQYRSNDSSALRFLSVTDIVVCGLSVLSLFFVWRLGPTTSNLNIYFFLFLCDLMTLVLMVSGCAAGTALGLISLFGEKKIGWVGVCDIVGRLCHQVTISITLSYLTFICYFLLTVMSAYKVMFLAK